jgi:AcrR family transcriptional regulator
MGRRADPEAPARLLAAARAAFAETGVEAARIEDICRAAGLSKGAFYLHFESKEDAFQHIVATFFAVMQDLQSQRFEAQHELRGRVGSPDAHDWAVGSPRLDDWARLDHEHTVRALQAMWRHRDVLRIILQHAPGLLDRFAVLANQMCSAQLAEAARHGGLRGDLDQELVGELIVGMYLQLGRRMLRTDRRPDFDAWARAVDTLIVEGLANRATAMADRRVSEGRTA